MSQPQASTSAAATVKRRRANSINAPDKRQKATTGAAVNRTPTTSDLGRLIDEAIDAVVVAGSSGVPSTSGAGVVVDVDVDVLRRDVVALREAVGRHEKTIAILEQRITDLLAAFGLAPVNSVGTATSASCASSSGGNVNMDVDVSPAALDASASSTANVSGSSSSASWVAVGAGGSKRRASPLAVEFKRSVVSAVYQDFDDRDRRAGNIIVSGLAANGVDDETRVAALVFSEFGRMPEIVRCRRLGRQQDGRVQKLLVALKDVKEAEFLLQHAKLLRQSGDVSVRSSVYFNADVTQAESHAAYIKRTERRRRAEEIRAARARSQQMETTSTVDALATTAAAQGRDVQVTGPVPGTSSSSPVSVGQARNSTVITPTASAASVDNPDSVSVAAVTPTADRGNSSD